MAALLFGLVVVGGLCRNRAATALRNATYPQACAAYSVVQVVGKNAASLIPWCGVMGWRRCCPGSGVIVACCVLAGCSTARPSSKLAILNSLTDAEWRVTSDAELARRTGFTVERVQKFRQQNRKPMVEQ